MSVPRYLTVKDVMAILQCGQTYAYELVERIGRARCPGMARVLESKFWEYLEGKDKPCGSTHERSEAVSESGGLRGPKTRSPSVARRNAPPSPPQKSSSPDGNESVRIPFTPRRKARPSASKRAAS